MTTEELLALFAQTQKKLDALAVAQTETAKQMRRTDKQLGELGNRLGSYMEHLMFPSMEKVLDAHFKMTVISQRVRSKQASQNLELDVLGYANGELNTAVVVEIKARFTEDSLQQILNTLAQFSAAFPEHADKKLYGIVAAVDISDNMRQRVLKHGLYLARINEDTFKLTVPRGFKPKNYGKKDLGPS